MRRQLVGMVAATTSLVLVALMVPMALLIQRFALEDALAAAALEVQATESVVEFQERSDLVQFVGTLNDNEDGARTTVLFEDGDAIGPDTATDAGVREARETRRALTHDTKNGVEILVPVIVGDRPAGGASEPDLEVSVIRVTIDESPIFQGVIRSWIILGGLGLVLLVVSIVLADWLARTLVRSVTGLAATAERLETGHLEARADPDGPIEVREVGHALNRLAARISELLTAERESAADLSHRLRTPLMALRLDTEELRDPEERAKVAGGVDTLARFVDELISEARRPVREGLGAVCDAALVVRSRTDFWMVLAEDQGRRAGVRVPSTPVLVKVSASDLQAAVDALLENVFSHTDEGTDFDVTVIARPAGGAELTVTDEGAGFLGNADQQRGRSGSGSTGLGLDIARRTAEASGGELIVESGPSGGAQIRMVLGPPR